ncbi:MAG: glycosyltransferase family 4 protein [Bacteroidota bacterium]
MRVLFINDGSLLNPILRSQGIPQLLYLAGKGYDVYMLSVDPREEKNKSSDRDKLIDQYGDKIHFLFYHPFSSKILKVSIQILVFGQLKVFYYIVRHRINIVHARSYLPAILGLFAKMFLGTKFIFDMRGLMVDEYISKGIWVDSSVLVKVMRFFEKRCILSADEIVVVSEKFREYVLQLPFVRMRNPRLSIVTIPNSVDLDRFDAARDSRIGLGKKLNVEGRIVLVYSGSLTSWQCFSEAVHLFSLCRRIDPRFFLLIVTYSEATELLCVIAQYGIGHSDYLIVEAGAEDVPKYLALGRIGILFRKEEVLNTVSCPIKFGEYLAAGLPVLVSRGIGDTENIVKENGVGIVSASLSESALQNMSRTLVEYLSEDHKGIDIACRAVASRYFSLESASEKYAEIYRRVTI